MIKKVLIINGVERTLVLEGNETLAKVLRERLLLTGCKIGCGEGHCGACNVIVDGKVTRSCITKVTKLRDYAEITTIEGIGTVNNLHPIQVAWMAYGCAQCGFCSPGFIMSAKGLLMRNPDPTREEVREWFTRHGNVCRCTGYKPIVDAVMEAAAVMRGEKAKKRAGRPDQNHSRDAPKPCHAAGGSPAPHKPQKRRFNTQVIHYDERGDEI